MAADDRLGSAYFERGFAQWQSNRLEAAESDLTRAIHRWTVETSSAPHFSGNMSAAYHARASVDLALGHTGKALADVERAMRWNPQSAVNYALRAEIKKAQGKNPDDYLADFKRAAELDSANHGPQFERALAELEKARQNAAGQEARAEREKTALGRAHNRLEAAWGAPLPKTAIPTALGGLGALFVLIGFGAVAKRRI